MTRSYFKDVHGVILVYDPGEAASLWKLREWMSRIEEARSAEASVVYSLWKNDNCNDTDLVDDASVRTFMAEMHIPQGLHFMVSSASHDNVRDSFYLLVNLVHRMNKGKLSRKDTLILEPYQMSDEGSVRSSRKHRHKLNCPSCPL